MAHFRPSKSWKDITIRDKLTGQWRIGATVTYRQIWAIQCDTSTAGIYTLWHIVRLDLNTVTSRETLWHIDRLELYSMTHRQIGSIRWETSTDWKYTLWHINKLELYTVTHRQIGTILCDTSTNWHYTLWHVDRLELYTLTRRQIGATVVLKIWTKAW